MMLVPHYELPKVWPQVSAWIESAVKVNQGDEDAIDVAVALDRGLYELWWSPDEFAAVVQVSDFPKQRVATILYCGGVLGPLKHWYQDAKVIAKSRGIDVLRIWGRAGWERVLGLDRVGVILQERL